jgi:hypothetical protein
MKLQVGVDAGSYTFNPGAKTITITGVDPSNVLPRDGVLAIIHAPTGQLLYQIGNQTIPAAAYTASLGGGTITLNAGVNTGGMTANDPLFILVSADRPLAVSNLTNKFREAFETYTPNGDRWVEVKAGGDIITIDGNTAGCSYLVVSKDPLSADTTSYIETRAKFAMPVEVAVGMSRSQAVIGTEFAFAVIDNDTIAPFADVAISSIQQATATLTVVTAVPHNLAIGRRIQISGVTSDDRLNYPALVVATIVSPTSFTATAGPGGTIASVTVGPFTNQGTVSLRPALAYAQNGTAQILENSSATNASFYLRSEAGDALPSGTIAGNHSVTIGSTASVQAVNAAFAYAFQPTTEYRLGMQIDRLQWADAGVDATGQTSNRVNRTQVVPSSLKCYKVRFSATNSKSLTRPVAKIISITKAGSTTWTVTTDAPHGLTTASYVCLVGNRDTTNFPNITTATVVTSVPTSTTFTVVSTTGTATGYGGAVVECFGSVNVQGAVTQTGQSVTRTSNILTLTLSAAISGLSVGDYVNLYGCRENTAGADVGVDGAYRVQSINSATLTLEPIAGVSPTGGDIALTNCGGMIIRRTDLRISFVRAMDFDRLRVEPTARPGSDLATAFPVAVQNAVGISGTVPVSATNLSCNTSQIAGASASSFLDQAGTNRSLGVVPSAPSRNNVTEVASGTITSTGVGSAISAVAGVALSAQVSVSAVSGTSPTLDTVLQESFDDGTTWVDIWHCERLTGVSNALIPAIFNMGRRRWNHAIGGTSPSFTRSINTMLLSAAPASWARQFFDRTAGLLSGTLNATSSAYLVTGCRTINARVALGAATTPGTYEIQVSDDGTNWSSVGTPTVAIANNVMTLRVADIVARWARVRCTSAATGQTGTYVAIAGG